MPLKAVILVNFGLPSEFTRGGAEIFLREFLGDKNVLPVPGIVRTLLAGRIASKRAGYYLGMLRRCMIEGVPQIEYYSRRIAQELSAKLGIAVYCSGAYGRPDFDETLRTALEAPGEGSVLVLPLYPQPSKSTTGRVREKTQEFIARDEAVKFHNCGYADRPSYISALAERVSTLKADIPLVVSFHAVPLSAGDGEYISMCRRTFGLLSSCAGRKTSLAWQSRMGRGEWTGPSVQETVMGLLKEGHKEVGVVCPGFFCDCLETTIEITDELKKEFIAAGGSALKYVACLNDSPAQADLLAEICRQYL